VHEGLDQAELLLHPVRVAADAAVEIQVEQPGQALDLAGAVAAADVGQEPESRPAGVRLIQAKLSGQVADFGAEAWSVRPAILTEESSGPRCGSQQSDEDPERRGLAGAIGTEETQEYSLRDSHGQVLECDMRAIVLGKGTGLDGGRHGVHASARVGFGLPSAKRSSAFCG
jgi:hypothetical protein